VAYELDLPTKLASTHEVFHMCLLKKRIGDDSTSVVPLEIVGVRYSLTKRS